MNEKIVKIITGIAVPAVLVVSLHPEKIPDHIHVNTYSNQNLRIQSISGSNFSTSGSISSMIAVEGGKETSIKYTFK